MARQLSGRLAYLFSVFQSQAPGPADWSRVGVSPLTSQWTLASTHTQIYGAHWVWRASHNCNKLEIVRDCNNVAPFVFNSLRQTNRQQGRREEEEQDFGQGNNGECLVLVRHTWRSEKRNQPQPQFDSCYNLQLNVAWTRYRRRRRHQEANIIKTQQKKRRIMNAVRE